ncbi:alpha/beta hydrolase [Paractinoplanes deccanensis]|uniref:Alpha/beta hydrolase n=1 Tax=Paractinoplanes deccanensis TaxID=113561 RepID=A0ABQ3YIN8_9ACTN|nr:alpha/beta hydrolase [Actinoplanes deccanensis]GID79871.1 alpha/beta hydrolase [Actinoplanes deccanensis]
MGTVESQDGTRIAFDEHGPADAPAVVHVYGATAHRAVQPSPSEIAGAAGGALRVIVFDRRGRGASGDTQPYEVRREIEDIAALIAHAGGRAVLLGESSGAVLALEAARAGLPVDGVVMFEPPFVVDDQRPPVPADYLPRLDALLAEDRREEALKLFTVESVGIPEEYLGGMTAMPTWEPAIRVAPTLRYDGRVMAGLMAGDPAPLRRYAGVTVPVLVLVGEQTFPFLKPAAAAIAEVLPKGELLEIPTENHTLTPQAVAPPLREFLSAQNR